MNVEIDENDLEVLIGIAAYLTAHVATGRSGAVTLDMIDGRLARDLRRFGLAEDESTAAVEVAMSRLTDRLHAALNGSRPDRLDDRRDAPDGEAFPTPLHRAAIEGDAAAVRAAIREGAEVNAIDSTGSTALFLAAMSQNVATLTELLDSGADTEIANAHGNTPLWPAIFFSKGDPTVARLLLGRGADPDHINATGNSPRTLVSRIANFDLTSLF